MSNQRQQVAESLQKQRETFSTIFQKAPYGVALVDKDGTYLYINPEFTSLTGYTLEDIPTGRKWFHKAYPDPEYRRKVIATWKEDIVQKGAGRVFSIACKNREAREIEFWSTLLDDGSTFIMLSDVTERRRLEEELRESEEKYRALFEDSRGAVFITTRDGKLTSTNQAYLDLFGYTREEVIGLDVRKTYANPEGRFRFQQEIERKGAVKDFELKLRKKDGTELDCLLTATVRQLQDGVTLGYQGIIRDITERKKLEEMKTQFINMLAHELKTPLTPILSSGKLLVEELESKGEIEHRLAKNILDGAHSLNSHLDELLELAKGEMGLLKVNPEPLEPGSLIQRLTGRWSTTFAAKKQEFQVELESPLPYVLADEGRTSQVLSNLLSNANKFTPERGQVTLRAGVKEDALVVEVGDSGPGILVEEQQGIFQPYTHSDGFPGLGLGLVIAKELVELQGGKIWCHSQPGKGSTFGFSLPLAGSEEQK